MSSDVRTFTRDSWPSELDRFSRQHEGWLVSLTTRTPDGKSSIEAHDLPLQGVSVASHTSDDVAVSLGTAQSHLTHDIRGVVAVRVELTNDRAERALVLDANDGSTTSIEFRSPKRTEEVDGLPAPDHR
jgi:uncharacterized protein DUF5335